MLTFVFRDLRRRMATQKNPKSIAGRTRSCINSALAFHFSLPEAR